MPLDDIQAKWLYDFTGGAIGLPIHLLPEPGDFVGELRDQLRLRQQKERVEEQALKEVLLTKAIKVLEANKDNIRKACDLQATTRNEKGKTKTEKVLGKDQTKTFEAAEANKLTEMPTKVGSKKKSKPKDGMINQLEDAEFDGGMSDVGLATQAYAMLVEEGKKLEAVKVERSYIDEKAQLIASRRERLFTDDEIMNELYSPLVREQVVPDTFIHPKYSATQKMIDGSNEYYIKECRDKGKQVGYGVAGLSKSAVVLATTVTNTVLGGLATVDHTKVVGLASSDTLTKGQSAHATDIVTGVAALLTFTIDAVDGAMDYRDSGDFSVSSYTAVMNNLGLGIGKIVSGCTGDMNLGVAITDAITAGTAASTLVPEFINWRKKGGEPPIASVIDLIGKCIAASFSTASDQTSGDTSTAWAQAGAVVGAAFATAAKAQEKHLYDSFMKGDWEAVMVVLADAGTNASKAVPVACKFAADYNNINESTPEKTYAAQQKQLKQMQDLANETDKMSSAMQTLGNEGMTAIAEKFSLKGVTPSEQERILKEIEKKFTEQQVKMKEEEAANKAREVKSIQEQLDAEQKEYQDSLNCLGSTSSDDADHKTIAKLIAQIETDRKIWDAMNALFGAGIGIATSATALTAVAAQVAPPLKAAGQLMKFIVNLKAAADRLDAWLTWRDSRKDAQSAVSPYATSIDNFVQNQGQQFTHYTVQAAAAVIQALLAAGEMSPYAPAFKAAGGAVAAAAATEDLVYKFIKQVALRRAWNDTKEALHPKNKGNRKMALLVRAINPTLAKYTIAYGALIEKSPIAITSMNRCGLDRETLTRAGDKVADVKKYLETLYVDDNKVVGMLDVAVGKTKAPPPALSSKAWTVSHLLWTENEKLLTPNPLAIVAGLAGVEKLLVVDRTTMEIEKFDDLLELLATLEQSFREFEPEAAITGFMVSVKEISDEYADLAQVTAKAVLMDKEVRVQALLAENLPVVPNP